MYVLGFIIKITFNINLHKKVYIISSKIFLNVCIEHLLKKMVFLVPPKEKKTCFLL